MAIVVLAPFAPRVTLSIVEVAVSAKLGGGVILRAIVVALVRSPDAPVIVTVEVPATAEVAAVKVTTLLPAVTAPSVAVTPTGKPDAANVTVPSKPC
jgi:hypothetical protein